LQLIFSENISVQIFLKNLTENIKSNLATPAVRLRRLHNPNANLFFLIKTGGKIYLGGTGIFAPAVSDSSNTMLQTLSDAFLAQFQNDEGQALTILSETITASAQIIIPFVLDNTLGRDTNIFISWPEDKPEPNIKLILTPFLTGSTHFCTTNLGI